MSSSLNSLAPSPAKFSLHHHVLRRNPYSFTLGISCALRRHHRRRLLRKLYLPTTTTTSTTTDPNSPTSNSKFQFVIDFEPFFPDNAARSLEQLLRASELRLGQLMDSSADALDDLRTLITVDADRRVVVSCERSTVNFLGNLALLGFIVVVTFKVLVKLGLGFRKLFQFRKGGGGGVVITRRDRSLGGREVVVGEMTVNKEVPSRVPLSNPLSLGEELLERGPETLLKNLPRKSGAQKLPSWWPLSFTPPFVGVDKEEYQHMANRLLRGKEYFSSFHGYSGHAFLHQVTAYDLISSNHGLQSEREGHTGGAYNSCIASAQTIDGGKVQREYVLESAPLSSPMTHKLRRICRESGVRVLFDATNSRDSFYRASIDYTLNICGSMPSQTTSVHIDGEDARAFIAGIAENIGLDKIRAARMVAAAVAARTRSWILQAWVMVRSKDVVDFDKEEGPIFCDKALEMQRKHSYAIVELMKLCFIHWMFPPEEGSPEMEMVARGLENHLKVEQREYLLDMVMEVCLEESQKSLAEALGLAVPTVTVSNQQENELS